ERGGDSEARAGSRHRHARAGEGRTYRCRVRSQRREKNRRWRRSRRKDADPHDDRCAAAEGRSPKRGRRGCSRDRRLSRGSSHQRGAPLRGSGGNMIGKLKGIVDSYGEDYVILDVGGVGYQVHCSARTMQALPSPGEAATLSIETHVREDQIKLFGFTSDIE